MIRPDGLNTVLAWVFFGVLLVLLVWLLRRSRRDDALSSISRPAADRPGAGDAHEPRGADRPNPDPPPGARSDRTGPDRTGPDRTGPDRTGPD